MKTLLATLALTAAPQALACPGLELQDGWIREAPPGAMMTVAYAGLRNAGKRPLKIDGGASRDFSEVTLHHTVLENGMYRMLDGEALELAPGARAALSPEGWHLMLMNPQHTLKVGDHVQVALSCGAQSSTFTFTVKAPSE